jgi:hypothetical protein
MDTNDSEEYAASIYGVKLCEVRKTGYIAGFQGRWSLRLLFTVSIGLD